MRLLYPACLALALLPGCMSARPAAAPPSAALAQGEEGLARTAADRASAVPEERLLARRAALRLAINGDDEAFAAATARAADVAQAAGGYAELVTERHAVLRVPDADLDATLDRLALLGEETDRTVVVEDVTDSIVDLRLRLANARALRDRLAALLDRASTVDEVLRVERELARVTVEVERLEGQLARAESSVSLARIDLRLDNDLDPGPLGWVALGTWKLVRALFVWG